MKVMIAEDEILVRLGLKKSIPWSTLGMELVCEAKDGAEAYELFKLHLPDIVLVDIELPKMDGLKFIRLAKAHRSGTHFIVLTCHQDMKYMREAIQLQVSDFILKSTLDMKELCDILQNIALKQARDVPKEQAKTPEAAILPDEAFYRNWLGGSLRDSARIRQQLARTVPDDECFIACVLQLDVRSHVHIRLSEADIRGMGQRLGRLLVQEHGEHILGIVEETHLHRWHFIVSERLAAADMIAWMDAVKANTGIVFSVGRSAPFVHPHEWQTHDRRTAELLQHQYYDPEGEGRLYEGAISLGEALPEPVSHARRELYERIGSLQFAEAKLKVYELKEALLLAHRLHPHIVKNMFTEFLFRMWSACEELAAGKSIADHRLVDQMYATQKLDQTASLLLADMERAERQLELTNSVDDKTKIIVLIKQYIKNHLQQEISLQEVADTFHLNSSYLSRLFREVSQMSFTEFVLFEKTELAIVMMRNGKSLTEISEKLGYLNLSSFTRMFKKVRGASPSLFLGRTAKHDK